MIMNRRDFIRTVGKGATAAGVSPKTVGKMLMNVAGGADAPAAVSAAPLNLAAFNQALKRLDSLSFDAAFPGFVTAANQKVIASSLKSDLLKVIPVLADYDIDFSDKADTALNDFNKVIKGEMDLRDTTVFMGEDFGDMFIEHIPYEELFKNGLLDQNFKKYFIDKHGEFRWALMHFRSLHGPGIKNYNSEWHKFLKENYPKTYEEVISQNKKNLDRSNYRKLAKSIDYSRMDKAGGAEDTDYAKYYENLKRFGSILEEMDRRGFLKMLGKGAAAAGVSPGAVGKMAMNLATGTVSKANLTNFISNYFLQDLPLFAGDNYGVDIESIEDLSYAADAIEDSISPVINAIKSSGIALPPHLLTLSNAILDQTNNIKGSIEMTLKNPDEYPEELLIQTGEGIINDLFETDGVLQDFNSNLLSFGFKTNTINPKTQKFLEDDYELYKCDFVNDPASKARKDKKQAEDADNFEKQQYRRQQQDIAKDINNSRMDYAGGSEDIDYAKYYEKVKTFDQLLSIVKEADDDIISGDTEGIEPGETGMPKGFGHPDRNRNYDDTVKLNVIYGVPEDVDNAYNTATGKKLQQFVKQQLPWLNEYSPESNLFYPGITYYDIATELQRVYEYFKYWVETEDYDKKNSYHVERKEHAMYFLEQYPGALNNFSRVFKYEEFLYGDSPSNPENINNYPLYVSLYDTTRELGGHEEGGWWYDIDRLVSSIPVSNLKQAEAAAKKLYNNMNNMNNMNLDGKPFIILEKQKGSLDTTNNPKPEYE